MSVTAQETVGAVRIEVDHRMPGAEGGPTLRVRDAGTGRERLRFDCFARGAHWHVDPAGDDVISQIGAEHDSIDWVLHELTTRSASYLEGAKLGDVSADAFAAAVARLGPALRNGPARFDALQVPVMRARSGEKWQQYPADVLPMWVADMDFMQADPIRRRLQRALDIGDIGYPWHPQPTALPEVFAERVKRKFGWRVDPRLIELTTEVVQSMHVIVHMFSEPGDGVVIQQPVYGPFASTVNKLGRRLEDNTLREAEVSYVMDLDRLREQAKRSKILLFCNPHNPTGRVMRREELEAVAEIAIEEDLLVVSDEIHFDLVYPGARHIPIASLSPEIEARTITLTSASKGFNIAGLRCAVAVFGSAELKARFMEFPRHLRGGIGSLGIMATEAAWRHAEPWLEDVLVYLEANRDFTSDFLSREMPGVRHVPGESTYFAWMDCRALELGGSAGRFFLENARVGLSDGPSFGDPGTGFARLNFATSREVLTDALGRMAEALRRR